MKLIFLDSMMQYEDIILTIKDCYKMPQINMLFDFEDLRRVPSYIVSGVLKDENEVRVLCKWASEEDGTPIKISEWLEEYKTSDGLRLPDRESVKAHEWEKELEQWYDDNELETYHEDTYCIPTEWDEFFEYLVKHKDKIKEIIELIEFNNKL